MDTPKHNTWMQIDNENQEVDAEQQLATPADTNGVNSPHVDSKTAVVAVSSNDFIAPDGGCRAWMVCFSACLANGTVFGVVNTYGILFVKILSEYDDGRSGITAQVALIGSISSGLIFILSAVSSVFVDVLGLRQTALLGAVLGFIGLLCSSFATTIDVLIFTYGVILGAGGAFLYPPSIIILGHYFQRHLGIVNGIVSCGSVVLSVTESLMLPISLDSIGLQYTFLWLSGLYLTMVFLVPLWKPIIPEEVTLEQGKSLSLLGFKKTEGPFCRLCKCCQKYINVSIFKNKRYMTWVFAIFVAVWGYFVPLTLLVAHVKQVMPEVNGPLLVTVTHLSSGVSRLIVGKIADFPVVNRIRIQQTSFCIMGTATIFIPWSTLYWHLVMLSLLFGMCDGMYVTVIGPIAFDIVGARHVSQSLGFVLSSMAFPALLGPFIAGVLKDNLGNYTLAFHFAGVPLIVSGMIMAIIPPRKENEDRGVSIKISVASKSKKSSESKRKGFLSDKKDSTITEKTDKLKK